jgi:rod shape-determining protein MreD
MAERTQSRLWLMRLIFVAVCLLIMFLHLLPLDTSPRSWAGPDLILALACAWVVRRPEFVPVTLIALVFVVTDLLYQMPPGLWAAFVVIGTETLRSRAPSLRDLTFPAEWFTVAVTLTLMTLGNQLTLALFLVDRPPLWLNLMQLVMTLVAYPLVAFGSQFLFGVRKQAPGDVDALANRR